MRTYRRHHVVIAALILLLLGLPTAVHAQYIYTTWTPDGTALITEYTGPGGDVTIPETLDGAPVTSIGPWAFQSNVALTNVTLPDSLTCLERGAFFCCSNLASIRMGAKLTNIGWRAFENCTSLASVTVPDSVSSVEDFAFANCTSLTNVALGGSGTSIGYAAFAACANLTTITVEATNAFYSTASGVLFDKRGLLLVQYPTGKSGTYTVPEGVTAIRDYAFMDATDLTSVRVPRSVTNIGLAAFGLCTNLSDITMDALNPAYSSADGVLFNKSQTMLVEYPGGKPGSYTIPDSATAIGDWAFVWCFSLTNVAIGKNVTHVGDYAFWSTGLTGLELPNNVSSIGDYAFYYCTSLTDATIGQGLTNMGQGAFSYCSSLLNVRIGNGVSTIAEGAFFGCTSLSSITLPGSLNGIGPAAFGGSTRLTAITIPNSVTNVGDRAFDGCTNLTQVYFQGNVPYLGSDVFYNANATIYYLPGTAGWGTSFGGLPAVLWNPQVQTSDGAFGPQTNGFGFNVSGASNLAVVVQACTDPANPAWLSLQTNTARGDSFYFNDPDWARYPARFYRLHWP